MVLWSKSSTLDRKFEGSNLAAAKHRFFFSKREEKVRGKEREKKEKRRWKVEAEFEASILCGCGAILQYCVILTIVVEMFEI